MVNFSTQLHSVSYAGLWGQASLPLDRFVGRAADLGYEGVMLMAKRPHLSILDYGPAERTALRSLLDKKRMKSVCVAAYNNLTADLERSEAPVLETQVQYILDMARLTADVGATTLRVFTGYEVPGIPFVRQWQHVVNVLREASRRAEEFGVTIGVQNHHDIAVGYESQAELIRAVDQPNCRALFDAWAPMLHGIDVNEAAVSMAPLTSHTTIANYRPLPRYHYQVGLTNYKAALPWYQAVPVSEGVIDFGAFLTTMHENGFSGSVAYEMCSPLRDGGSIETLDRYAEQFVEFMASLRQSVEIKGAMV